MWSKLREVDPVWLSTVCWLCALLIFEWRWKWSFPAVGYLVTLPCIAKAYVMVLRNPILIMTTQPIVPYIYIAVFTVITVCLGPIGLAFSLAVVDDRQKSIDEKWRKSYMESIERYGHPIRRCINPQLAELIETERSYLYSLRELESRILAPIQQDPEQVGMQADEIKLLVNQFPEIIGLVQCFVNQLDTCINDEGVVQTFLDFTQHFKMYATLVVNLFGHRPWIELQMQRNARFRTFVDRALEQATHQALDDYFIMPVQRVTRYPMLFKGVDARCFHESENLARHVNMAMALAQTMKVPVYCMDLMKEELKAANRRLERDRTYLNWLCAAAMAIWIALSSMLNK
jgi:hypothetical protein